MIETNGNMSIERIKIVLVCCSLAVCLNLFKPPLAQGEQNPAGQPPKNYERFTHKSHLGTISVPGTNHARVLKCESCHDRRDPITGLVETTARNQQLSLRFPGHKACVECHISQFTAQPQQTCTICHETRGGQPAELPARPPQRDFPQRSDFNALFDARQHELHAGYNMPRSVEKLNCNFCHRQEPRPAVLTIAAHPECYLCHSPASTDQKAAQKSGCVACHTAVVSGAQPFSAKYVSRAYGALFTHKSHVGYMNGKCDMCHTISGGYNQPTPTSLKVKQHISPAERSGRGCFSCHDGGMHYGRKVFSGEPGSQGGGSCNKCHTRNDFKVFPSSG